MPDYNEIDEERRLIETGDAGHENSVSIEELVEIVKQNFAGDLFTKESVLSFAHGDQQKAIFALVWCIYTIPHQHSTQHYCAIEIVNGLIEDYATLISEENESNDDVWYFAMCDLLLRPQVMDKIKRPCTIAVIFKLQDEELIAHFMSPCIEKLLNRVWNEGISSTLYDERPIYNRGGYCNRLIENIFHLASPRNQYICSVVMAVVYLFLYSYVLNCTDYKNWEPEAPEILFYLFALGDFAFELERLYVGGNNLRTLSSHILSLPASCLTFVSFIFRMVAMANTRLPIIIYFNTIGYNLLASVSPLLWLRVLGWLDIFEACWRTTNMAKLVIRHCAWLVIPFGLCVWGFAQSIWAIEEDEPLGKILDLLIRAFLGNPEPRLVTRYNPGYNAPLFLLFLVITGVFLINLLLGFILYLYTTQIGSFSRDFRIHFSRKVTNYINRGIVFPTPFNIGYWILFGWWMRWISMKKSHIIKSVVWLMIFWPTMLVYWIIERQLPLWIGNIWALVRGRRHSNVFSASDKPIVSSSRPAVSLRTYNPNSINFDKLMNKLESMEERQKVMTKKLKAIEEHLKSSSM
ncbi:uncharacterized protein VTP21DRAFT_10455 [Calcarisporiella thermophila]|uniref:uncharacterized protein n=1 Tax=Calcarisporiella thermophila TaxID=911321 RepID=UPI003743A355